MGKYPVRHIGGYGSTKIEGQSKITDSKANARIDGYHVGVYSSWIPEAQTGPYVDVWGQYAWFNNKLTGAAQKSQEAKYDSSALTLSAEVGYGMPIGESKNLNWKIEPHAQLIYTFFNSDNFTDKNNTHFYDAKGDGFRSRLGARIYGTGKDGVGVSPFVEANWLYDGTDNSIKVTGDRTINAHDTKNLGEVKLGFEGHFNKNLSAWAHVGGQWGGSRYSRYEGQIGLGYKW